MGFETYVHRTTVKDEHIEINLILYKNYERMKFELFNSTFLHTLIHFVLKKSIYISVTFYVLFFIYTKSI